MNSIRSRFVPVLLAALIALTLATMSACGDRAKRAKKDTPVGTPVPDTPREHSGAGTPLLLFGGGSRGRPGENDELYQEYLIWKEWQQYKKYKEWAEQQRQNEEQQSRNEEPDNTAEE